MIEQEVVLLQIIPTKILQPMEYKNSIVMDVRTQSKLHIEIT